MSEQQNLELVRQGYAAFGRGDIEGIVKLLDSHVSWVTPGPEDVPTAGTRRGHAAVRQFFATLLSTFDITSFEPRDFLTQGDKVVVLGNSAEGPRGTGRTVDFRWVHIFTVRNGLVVSFEERADVSALVEELRAAQARA